MKVNESGSVRHFSSIAADFEKVEPSTPELLLVEDDETDILFVSRCLAKADSALPLVIARDGLEALDILRKGRAEGRHFVVLTDLNMPGMSGHEMIAEIRGDTTLSDLVIFVLSSSSLAGDIRRAYSQNVAGYLSKQGSIEQQKLNIAVVADYCRVVNLPRPEQH